jgi:hypothetical protein
MRTSLSYCQLIKHTFFDRTSVSSTFPCHKAQKWAVSKPTAHQPRARKLRLEVNENTHNINPFPSLTKDHMFLSDALFLSKRVSVAQSVTLFAIKLQRVSCSRSSVRSS